MFEKTFVINLHRRPERLAAFYDQLPGDLPFGRPERFAAIDGDRVKKPLWWGGLAGAWGCLLSHARVLEQCLNDGVDSVLIFEDDAVFRDDWRDIWVRAIPSVPRDWDMLLFGGDHVLLHERKPRRVSSHWYSPHTCLESHAYAVRGRFMQILYDRLTGIDWTDDAAEPGHYSPDVRASHLQRIDRHGIYCIDRWIAYQSVGMSDTGDYEKTKVPRDTVEIANG